MIPSTSSRSMSVALTLFVVFPFQDILCQPFRSPNEAHPFQPDSVYATGAGNDNHYSSKFFADNDNQNNAKLLPVKRSQDAESGVDELHLASERNAAAIPKRAPLAFMGPRGKKVLAEQIRAMLLNNNNHNNNNLNHNHLDEEDDIDGDETDAEPKRMGVRGRKDIVLTEAQLQQLRQFIQQQREEYLQEMLSEGGATAHSLRLGGKRDPLKGFMGVRGKRILERLAGLELNVEDQQKRSGAAPTMGFVGMRGKKWVKPETSSEESENYSISNAF